MNNEKVEIEIVDIDEKLQKKRKKKIVDWKVLFKPFIFWFIIILYLEGIFAFITFDTYLRESVINIFIHSLIAASFYSIVSLIFKEKINKIITGIILGILGFIFSVQLVFYQIFKAFFSFSVMGLGNQLTSFIGQTFKCIFENLFYIILLFLPLILYFF